MKSGNHSLGQSMADDMSAVTHVRASSRIHLGLLDLGRATGRTFGGLALMLAEPPTEIVARTASHTQLIFPPALRSDTKNFLTRRLLALIQTTPGPGAHVEIRTSIPEHIGLGSKTSMTLATLFAAATATGRQLDAQALQRLSGRGRASAIGID